MDGTVHDKRIKTTRREEEGKKGGTAGGRERGREGGSP
jgi:hypothetical protein